MGLKVQRFRVERLRGSGFNGSEVLKLEPRT